MNIAQFETLEAHVVSLVEAFVRVKEENEQLNRNVKRLQDTLDAQQQELARLRPDQEELAHLRTVMQTLQEERDVIRQKLEQMLVTIEWLEERSRVESETKA